MEKHFSCYADKGIRRAFKVKTMNEVVKTKEDGEKQYQIIEVSERRVYPGKLLSDQFKNLDHMTCDEFIWRIPIPHEDESRIEEIFNLITEGLKADHDLDVSMMVTTPITKVAISIPEKDRPSKSLKRFFDTDRQVIVMLTDPDGEEHEFSFMFDCLDPNSRNKVEETYNMLFNREACPESHARNGYSDNLEWCLNRLKTAEAEACAKTYEQEKE